MAVSAVQPVKAPAPMLSEKAEGGVSRGARDLGARPLARDRAGGGQGETVDRARRTGVNKTTALLVVLAALMGAGGVVLAAASAHAVPNAGLDSAGHMLSLHAAAVLGGAAILNAGLVWRPLGAIALFGLADASLDLRGRIARRRGPPAGPVV